MLITDQVATAPCTDPIQDDFPTFEAKQPDAIITKSLRSHSYLRRNRRSRHWDHRRKMGNMNTHTGC